MGPELLLALPPPMALPDPATLRLREDASGTLLPGKASRPSNGAREPAPGGPNRLELEGSSLPRREPPDPDGVVGRLPGGKDLDPADP
mmetsp:Transcript_38421/g.59787  ORF Transcript_38421/g.59787 Transcript_38421/m.59787 type:complete len:88 (-) Transcript_38421:689-952(-)